MLKFLLCKTPRKPKSDVSRTIRELVESRGVLFESHDCETKDGYILTLHRIKNSIPNNNNANPVLLQHGIGASSVQGEQQ